MIWEVVQVQWRNVREITRTHVMPVGDWRDHSVSECWCEPVADDDEPNLLVHNSMDGREAFETGQRLPS